MFRASTLLCVFWMQVIFGLEVTNVLTGSSKILLNPGDMKIPGTDGFSVRGFIIAKDEVMAAAVLRSAVEPVAARRRCLDGAPFCFCRDVLAAQSFMKLRKLNL